MTNQMREFMKINFGHILTIVVLIVGMAVAWGSLGQRIRTLEDTDTEIRSDVKQATIICASRWDRGNEMVKVNEEDHAKILVKLSSIETDIKWLVRKEGGGRRAEATTDQAEKNDLVKVTD